MSRAKGPTRRDAELKVVAFFIGGADSRKLTPVSEVKCPVYFGQQTFQVQKPQIFKIFTGRTDSHFDRASLKGNDARV